MEESNKNEFTIQDGIQLLDVYFAEKNHRDGMYWKQMYFYYAIAFSLMLIPFITDKAKEFMLPIPACVFEILAIFLAVFSLYVSFAYMERDKKVRDAIEAVMGECVPDNCRIKKLDKCIYSMSVKKVVAVGICLVELFTASSFFIILLSSAGCALNCSCCFMK